MNCKDMIDNYQIVSNLYIISFFFFEKKKILFKFPFMFCELKK